VTDLILVILVGTAIALGILGGTTYLAKRTIRWVAPGWAANEPSRLWAVALGLALAALATFPLGPIAWALWLLILGQRRGRLNLQSVRTLILWMLFLGSSIVAIVAAIGATGLDRSLTESYVGSTVIVAVALLFGISVPMMILWFYASRWNPQLKAQLENLVGSLWRHRA